VHAVVEVSMPNQNDTI
jgi:hypothetical protein